MKEIEEIFLDELDCDESEIPKWLYDILVDDEIDDEEKYAAIEKFQTKYSDEEEEEDED